MKLAHLASVLLNHQPQTFPVRENKPAAVLIPIMGNEIIFTERAAHLPHHPGQISFPGGRLEPKETGQEAAIRESEEELGIQPQNIKVLGRLHDVWSPKLFHIQCFVAALEPQKLLPNPDEVGRVFKVPISQIFEPHRHETKPWPAKPERDVHYYHFDEGLVWGVTGQMTYNLIQTWKGQKT